MTADPTRRGGYRAPAGTAADVPTPPRGPAPGADPTTEQLAVDRREHVVANAIAWELYGVDGRPTSSAGDTLAIRVTDAELDAAYRAARRVLAHLAEPKATGQLDLDAVMARAESALDWVRRGTDDGWLPLSVREHFETDTPALAARVRRLNAELDNAHARVAVAHQQAVWNRQAYEDTKAKAERLSRDLVEAGDRAGLLPAQGPCDCERCGSTRWVGYRAGPEHEGWPRRAQCVPCGHVQTTPAGWDGGA